MNLLKNIAFLLILNISYGGEVKVVKCEYDFGNKSMVMGIGKLKKTINANQKINGLSYKYHIENINKFNEMDDYVEIVDKNEKKITFFLKCK